MGAAGVFASDSAAVVGRPRRAFRAQDMPLEVTGAHDVAVVSGLVPAPLRDRYRGALK